MEMKDTQGKRYRNTRENWGKNENVRKQKHEESVTGRSNRGREIPETRRSRVEAPLAQSG